MSNLTGEGLAKFAISKLGTPYVYGAKGADGAFTQSKLNMLSKSYKSIFTSTYISKAKKFVGKVCCDCSGLISWYTGKVYGSAQLYQMASRRTKIDKSDISKIPVGAVVWKEGHVGVYIGDGYIVEEMGIDYGCVKTKLIDRTFTYYLLFDWITYASTSVDSKAKARKTNIYKKPLSPVKLGNTGDNVRWVQWELVEAGYNIKIDGKFGKSTLEAVKKFQSSCKIPVDGIVGNKTINKLIENK